MFSSVLSQQQQHIATCLQCPWFSVEIINSFGLILYNGSASNRCCSQKFLRQKINSLKIKACHIQWKPTTNCKIFRDFLMFYQSFLSPQVKLCTIIAYKHGIYELPHELLNNFRLRTLGNYDY